MKFKKNYCGIVLFVCIITMACTNSHADFNNKLFDIHNNFQNEIKDLDQKLNADSITTDSANVFLALAENKCKLQYDTLQLLKPSKDGIALHNAALALFDKQLYSIALQKKMMLNSEPGKNFSDMQDSLDATSVLIDSLDAKLKATQIEFAKVHNFKLQ